MNGGDNSERGDRGDKSGSGVEAVRKRRRDKDGLRTGLLDSARECDWVVGSQILTGTRITEWRCRRVVDMRDMETPRMTESSLLDNGLNASTIAPKTCLMSANSSDSWTSENACTKIWEYRESMPEHPSCIVLSTSERRSWRR